MSLFDADELADLRADLAELFTDSCVVQRFAKSRDAGGGIRTVFSPHGPAVPCRLWNKQGPGDLMEMVEAAGLVAVGVWFVLLPFTADVRDTDRLSVTSAGVGTKLLEIAGTDRGASDALGLLCVCREIEAEADDAVRPELTLSAPSIIALNTERAAHGLPSLTSPPVGSDVDATIALFVSDLAAVGSGFKCYLNGNPFTGQAHVTDIGDQGEGEGFFTDGSLTADVFMGSG